MKKLLTGLLLLISIFILVLIISTRGCQNVLNLISQKTLQKTIFLRVAIEDKIIGGPFLGNATDIHWDAWKHITWSPFKQTKREIIIQTFWVVAKLPTENFYKLVDGLRLNEEPDLLDLWPDSLTWQHGDMRPKEKRQHYFYEHWDVSDTVNEDTYYAEIPEEQFQGEENIYNKSVRISAKYENGKMYFKKVITYISIDDEIPDSNDNST